jgi:perosamine synthetase
MTDIQAALGLAQMEKSEKLWQMRTKIAERYNIAFSNVDEIGIPTILSHCKTSWHLYVIKLALEHLSIGRNRFIEILSERDIKTSVHFIPLYRHPYYQKVCQVNIDSMPNSEWLFERIVSLPIYPGMSDGEVDYVIENVLDIIEAHAT